VEVRKFSAGRTWGVFSIFAMWMSDVHSVGGYTFAASLFFLGLTGWEVLLAMVVGITAVYFLMNLIGRPSLKYGTPFPVVARMSFGVMGANIAAGSRHRRNRLVRRLRRDSEHRGLGMAGRRRARRGVVWGPDAPPRSAVPVSARRRRGMTAGPASGRFAVKNPLPQAGP
jgi:hypothetical protein